jgi:hypothetical protein
MTVFGTVDPVSPPSGSTASDFSTGIVNFSTFMRLLAPPTPAPAAVYPATSAATASSSRGSVVFNNIGCQACHVAQQTAAINGLAFLNSSGPVKLSLFGEFAVHNMGYGLADGIAQGMPMGGSFVLLPCGASGSAFSSCMTGARPICSKPSSRMPARSQKPMR